MPLGAELPAASKARTHIRTRILSGRKVARLMDPVLLIGVALGLRHGTDPDHLAAIDGLIRLRPNHANGVFFALGHGLTVILLAVGVGHVIAGRLSALGPWTLIAIGTLNLWRMIRGRTNSVVIARPIVLQPFLLGVMLAAGFETASQLSALLLAGSSNAWLLGLAFLRRHGIGRRRGWSSGGLYTTSCRSWSR